MSELKATAHRRRRTAAGVITRGLALALACGPTAWDVRTQAAAPDAPVAQTAALAPQVRAELEPAVAEHIRSLEASTEAMVREGAADDRLAQARGLLGQVYQAYALPEPAEASYLAAHRLAPADFRWPYLLASVLQQQNRPDEALTYYERARAIRGDYAPLSVNVGNLLLAQNRLDDAKAAYEAALAMEPSIAAARYGLGQVAMSRRDYAQAVEHFTWVLTRVPDANRVHYTLGMAYRGLGQVEQAQDHLRRQGPVGVRVADPLVDGLADLVKGARLSLVRGRLAFEAGRYGEAAEAFRSAVTAEPDSVPALVNLGSALGQLRDVDGAIAQFARALALDPDNRSALFNLGALHAQRNRHDEAVRHLTRLIEVTPDDHQARAMLGRELGRAGRLDDALAAFAAIARADPDNEEAALGQADVLTSLGRHREALDTLEQAHARAPTRGRTAAGLAYLLAASQQPDLRNYSRALDLARRVHEASGALGDGAVIAMALAGLGRCTEAVEWQRQLIAKAEQENSRLVAALRADLARYEASCR